MADEDGALLAELVEQAHEIPGEVQDVVVLDRVGTAGTAVAALVRRDHAATGGGERAELVSPREGELGKTVGEHDRCTGAGLEHVQVDAVGPDRSLVGPVHQQRP